MENWFWQSSHAQWQASIVQAERFPPPSSKTPGPGAYTVSKESDWVRNTYPPPQAMEVPRTVSYHNRDAVRVCDGTMEWWIPYIHVYIPK